MIDIFKLQPEWVEDDDRKHRQVLVPSHEKSGPSLSYNINPEFMYHRHRVMLPPELIKGKTILDVGSCMGATGAWCLANGSSHYTGIEQLERYVTPSNKLFKKYYQSNQYEIIHTSIDTFVSDKKYDIVVASGMLYAVFDSFCFIKKITELAKETIIIDTVHPFNGYRRLFPEASDEDRKRVSKTLSIVQPSERIRMQGVNANGSVRITASIVSLQALILLMKNNKFSYDSKLYDLAEKEIPYYYNITVHNRYMAKFFPQETIDNSNQEIAVQWNGNSIKK